MPISTTTPISPTRCSRCCSFAGATRTRPGCAQILDAMLAHFEDPKLGGFFFTSDDHEALIHRSKSFSDDAIPAGNGIAARALIRAGYLLGETRWLDGRRTHAARRWLAINRFPHGHMSLLEALAEYLKPPEIVIIRETDERRRLAARARQAVCAASAGVLDPGESRRTRCGASPTRRPAAPTRAYVCRGSTCSAPVESLAGSHPHRAVARSSTRVSAFLRRFARRARRLFSSRPSRRLLARGLRGRALLRPAMPAPPPPTCAPSH